MIRIPKHSFALTIVLVAVCLTIPAAADDPPDPAAADLALEPPTFPDGGFDAMPVMLEQLRGLIQEAQDGGGLADLAQRLFQVHYMSGIAVLPTPGVEETGAMFRQFIAELERSVAVIDQAAHRGGLEPAVAAGLLDVKLTLEADLDALQTLAVWTASAKPGSPRARRLSGRQIRSPFVPLPFPVTQPHEVVTSDVIGVNECMVVVKEIQGMKARLVLRILPVWIEPWFARRRIVGQRLIWVREYVPAQFIKRVITCNDCCNKIRPQILTEIVEHPELLDFWRFFKKGHYVHKPGH